MSVNNNINHREIAYNLELLEKSLKEGKATDIDIGFIEIFANDIASLRSRSPSKKLSARLTQIAEKIYDVQETVFFPANPNDAIRPLVGKTITFDQLAKEYREGNVKTGLESLAPHFSMKPIAGDGHCLFRSTAVGILEFLQTTSVENQRNFFGHLANSVTTLKKTNPKLEPKYERMLGVIKKINSKQTTPEEVLKNRQTSDLLVDFLRELACSYNQVHGDEVFESEATVESGSKKAYLDEIKDMAKASLGGQPEILALNKTLGIDLIVLDARAIGREEMKTADLIKQAKKSPLPLFLLFRPGHYDYAFPKT